MSLWGRVFQRLRDYFPGVCQRPDLSLKCTEFQHPRPAELTFYCMRHVIVKFILGLCTIDNDHEGLDLGGNKKKKREPAHPDQKGLHCLFSHRSKSAKMMVEDESLRPWQVHLQTKEVNSVFYNQTYYMVRWTVEVFYNKHIRYISGRVNRFLDYQQQKSNHDN